MLHNRYRSGEPNIRDPPHQPMRNVLVTGGLGFVGSNYINHILRTDATVTVYNIDKMSYCSNERNIQMPDSARYVLTKGDIVDVDCVMRVLVAGHIDTIIHFAAETHVTRSFVNSLTFTMSNVYGTHVLLECARRYGKIGKIIFVSTDEVYGEVDTPQQESDATNPTTPYAATKAAAELLIKSYCISFNMPAVIIRSNNIYGPYQYPEKIIPRFIMLAHNGKKLTVEGSGNQMRSFLHVSDFSRALDVILKKGAIGEVYNIGTRDSFSVREIAKCILTYFVSLDSDNAYLEHVEFVKDRVFNDINYDMDTTKLEKLGWLPLVSFDVGLTETVQWYKNALDRKHWPNLSV